MVLVMTNDDDDVTMTVVFIITILTILLIVTIITIITVLILQRKDFPSNSFYVVVVVKTEDQACGGSLPFYPFIEDEPVDQGHRQKTLSVLVSRAVTSEAYMGGMLFCLGIFLSFYLLTVLLACWENWRQRKKSLLVAVDRACPENGHPRVLADSFPGSSPYEGYNYGSFENGSGSTGSTDGLVGSVGPGDLSYNYQGHDQFKRRLPFGQMRQLCIAMDHSLDPVGTRPRLDSMSSVEEDDYDTLADIDSDKNVIRTKWGRGLTPASPQQYLCVADLARKDKRVLRKKYQIYFWNIATIAVFYALPVVQLVITYQTNGTGGGAGCGLRRFSSAPSLLPLQVVNVTGNQDICYYNFLCAHPLGNLSAFNNILSNLGYILLGLLFLLIILQREINHNRALLRNDLYALVRSARLPAEASGPALPSPAQPCPALPSPALPSAAQPCPALPSPAVLSPAQPCPALPSPALPCPAQPSPAQPCPAQPSPAQPCPAQPSPAQPSPAQPSPALPSPAQPALPSPALPCPAQPSPALPSPALPTPAQPSPALPSPALPRPAQPCPAQPCPVLSCPALLCPALPGPALAKYPLYPPSHSFLMISLFRAPSFLPSHLTSFLPSLLSPQQECGIPKHFGLFYAMGTALMMEGLLSACYHVCPNYTNFQFDTSFMYMIAGLCMLKLYQKRHPDINASAYSAYACLAIVIFFSVLGVVRPRPALLTRRKGAHVFGKGNTAFWVIFSVIHIIATLLLSTQLYYMGRWKLGGPGESLGTEFDEALAQLCPREALAPLSWRSPGAETKGCPCLSAPSLLADSGICRRILHVLYTDCIRQCSGPLYVDRMVLLVMGNIINWSLAAYGLIMRPNDFASYLLAIGICNLLLYFAFYIIMKLRSGERIKLIPLLCIICTSVVWGFALFFFFQGLSTWQKTPAESREHNRDCILLDFFDDHDIWHFLSSIAMFGSFLVLLTLDDDLDTVQRDKIYVF
ncbi:hypothetical protein J1605_011899 [Eschrichtius robustus]|uniref:SID1 transmembrane family member 2 n=1 Tax=Eschrichtius robustus TaxID=9764 RepID=A0AB34GKI4_ESCRO|nr:hypothetical protein J1605_011899 [Eschrichtius robustus]